MRIKLPKKKGEVTYDPPEIEPVVGEIIDVSLGSEAQAENIEIDEKIKKLLEYLDPTTSGLVVKGTLKSSNFVRNLKGWGLSFNKEGDAYFKSVSAGSYTQVFVQASVPTSIHVNDLWYDSDDGYKPYKAAIAGADAITAGEWETVQDESILAEEDISLANLGEKSVTSLTAGLITGSTLRTGTSGANVHIQSSRVAIRDSATEVAFLEKGTNGGSFGLKDTSGNAIASWNVRASGADVTFQCSVGDLFIDPAGGDVVFVGGSGHDIYPATDTAMNLGFSSNRWADVRSVLINGADYGFEHHWYLTENYKVGIEEDGIAVLNEKNKLIMFIGESGLYTEERKNISDLAYVKTTLKQRARMDKFPNERNVIKDKKILDIPNPDDAETSGAVYVEKEITIKKNI